MTEDRFGRTMGQCVEEVVEWAHDSWIAWHGKKRSREENLAGMVTQTIVHLNQRPGGRLTVHTTVQGRRHSQVEHFYNSFQYVPDVGYVAVYKRNR